jgi:hypothetical protein
MILTERQAKTVDVVPDGPDQMDERVAGQQSLQSGAVESGEKRVIQDFLPRLHWLARAKFFRCWGSGCMMWRWADRDAKMGFCGLAGNPLQNLFSD